MAGAVSIAIGSLHSLSKMLFRRLVPHYHQPILSALQLVHKLQNSKASWHVKSFPLGNDAPRKKFTVIVTAVSCCSKEIRSPVRARLYRDDIHRRDGYANLSGPNMILGVDASGVLKA